MQFLTLLTVANAAPVLTAKFLGTLFSLPIDRGAQFLDGRPVFGPSKTVRGIVVAVLATTLTSRLIGLDWDLGILVGAVAMAGDLLSSFVKRRLGRPPSSRMTGVDQVPESLLPLLACRQLLSFTPADIAVVAVTFFAGDVLLSRLLYVLRIRDRPY
ncbi:MAG TPA: CDP-archaeol synthase [Vicinamibacterales bacterium]|nr:CDP-archaeol synthase [Vicinamibacterales bacterium]